MSTTPIELFTHASSLPESTEVERRVKISRLYYALYSHACEFCANLDSQGLLLKNDVGTHKKLTQRLTNPTVTDKALQDESRKLGTRQTLAHELRLMADYDLDEEILSRHVQTCVKFVREGMAIKLPEQAAA